ncbi:hypothetical protein [Lactococcus cremoris]|uniref:hypothetical protein n=1 Tax=Lactococcus lactis subsp. cremoris TaxID=1359 RepID=UPI0003AB6BEE|nr:hypothetical protein [Lactococcus cremoris]AGV72852.1 phage-related protein [Lactococcus cremoris subsp. cremoris KW2]
MKKTTILTSICLMGAAVLLGSIIPTNVSADSSSNENISVGIINRVYNPNTGEHVYTNSIFEESRLTDLGWSDEGNAFFVPEFEVGKDNSNQGPLVSRLYNPNAGDHFYTSNQYEISELVKKGWKRDQIIFPTAKVGVPVYRLYNPNATVGAHFYTTSSFERDNLVNHGWKYEGVAFNSLRA